MCSWHKKSIPTKLPRLSNQTFSLSPLHGWSTAQQTWGIWDQRILHGVIIILPKSRSNQFYWSCREVFRYLSYSETFKFIETTPNLSSQSNPLCLWERCKKSKSVCTKQQTNPCARSQDPISREQQRGRFLITPEIATPRRTERSANQNCQTSKKLWTRHLMLKREARASTGASSQFRLGVVLTHTPLVRSPWKRNFCVSPIKREPRRQAPN